jgi:tetratricopeptide (TPR) repeat protein
VAYQNRANAYLRTKAIKEALADYNKALELNPGLAEAYYNRAIIHRALKNNQEACQDWQSALDRGIEQAAAYLKKYCARRKPNGL